MKPEKRPAQKPVDTGTEGETRQHALSSPIEEALAIDLTLPYRKPLPLSRVSVVSISWRATH